MVARSRYLAYLNGDPKANDMRGLAPRRDTIRYQAATDAPYIDHVAVRPAPTGRAIDRPSRRRRQAERHGWSGSATSGARRFILPRWTRSGARLGPGGSCLSARLGWRGTRVAAAGHALLDPAVVVSKDTASRPGIPAGSV